MLSTINSEVRILKVLIKMESASSDSVPVDEIKDLLTCTCSLCSKTLTEPRSLSCLHNFCKLCLGEYIFSPLMGYSNLYPPPSRGTGKFHGGESIFPNGKFHGGRHFWTGNSKEGVKNTYKTLEIPWEGDK